MTESAQQFIQEFSEIFDTDEGWGFGVILRPNYTSTTLMTSLTSKQLAEALSDVIYRWCIKAAERLADAGENLENEDIYRNMRAITDAAYNMAVMQYARSPETHTDLDNRATNAASALRAKMLAQRQAQKEDTPQTTAVPPRSPAGGASPQNTAATSTADVEAAVRALLEQKGK